LACDLPFRDRRPLWLDAHQTVLPLALSFTRYYSPNAALPDLSMFKKKNLSGTTVVKYQAHITVCVLPSPLPLPFRVEKLLL
jgi:hypothetical protein